MRPFIQVGNHSRCIEILDHVGSNDGPWMNCMPLLLLQEPHSVSCWLCRQRKVLFLNVASKVRGAAQSVENITRLNLVTPAPINHGCVAILVFTWFRQVDAVILKVFEGLFVLPRLPPF